MKTFAELNEDMGRLSYLLERVTDAISDISPTIEEIREYNIPGQYEDLVLNTGLGRVQFSPYSVKIAELMYKLISNGDLLDNKSDEDKTKVILAAECVIREIKKDLGIK